MHFNKSFNITDDVVLVSGKSPNAGTSGTALKNLNTLDNLLNYGAFAQTTFSISSSNQTADIAIGIGAHSVRVFGLDASFNPQILIYQTCYK